MSRPFDDDEAFGRWLETQVAPTPEHRARDFVSDVLRATVSAFRTSDLDHTYAGEIEMLVSDTVEGLVSSGIARPKAETFTTTITQMAVQQLTTSISSVALRDLIDGHVSEVIR